MMNRMMIPGLMLLLTLGTVILLPQLYSVHASAAQQKYALTAFSSHSKWKLESDNIVDALDRLPLTLTIRKVEWESRMLTIDLKVTAPETSASEIYTNIAEVLSFCFDVTSNVDQVYLRMVAEDKWLGTRHLLLAADVIRADWSPELNRTLAATGDEPLPDSLRQRFHVTETKLWNNQFDKP